MLCLTTGPLKSLVSISSCCWLPSSIPTATLSPFPTPGRTVSWIICYSFSKSWRCHPVFLRWHRVIGSLFLRIFTNLVSFPVVLRFYLFTSALTKISSFDTLSVYFIIFSRSPISTLTNSLRVWHQYNEPFEEKVRINCSCNERQMYVSTNDSYKVKYNLSCRILEDDPTLAFVVCTIRGIAIHGNRHCNCGNLASGERFVWYKCLDAVSYFR